MSHEECLLRFRMRMNEDGHVIPRSQPLCNGGGRDCVLIQVLWGRVTLASPRRQGDLVSRSVGRLDSLQRLGTSNWGRVLLSESYTSRPSLPRDQCRHRRAVSPRCLPDL